MFINNLNLFPILVQKYKIEPSQEEYQVFDTYLNALFNRATEDAWALETGKSTGEYNLFLHERPESQWLMPKVFECVYHYWSALHYRTGAKIECTSAWANSHKFGQVTGEHSHCGGAVRAHISAAYYFKKPALSGNIEFVDPLEYIHKMTPIHEYSEYTPVGISHMYTEVDASQFELVLFPSWLKHRTQTSQTNDERVCVSMNFIGHY
jgi:uncharacterized protein (TIGR02466 family)